MGWTGHLRDGADAGARGQSRPAARARPPGDRRGASRGSRQLSAHHRHRAPAQCHVPDLRRHRDAQPGRQARSAPGVLERRRSDPDRRTDRLRPSRAAAHLRHRCRRPGPAHHGAPHGRRFRHGRGRRDHEPVAGHGRRHPPLAGKGRRAPDGGVLLDRGPCAQRDRRFQRGRCRRRADPRRHGRYRPQDDPRRPTPPESCGSSSMSPS